MTHCKKFSVYSIFDDFGDEAAEILRAAGATLTVHPLGEPRPTPSQMKNILETYDAAIIGTSQKITPDMFESITSPRIIGTASVGTDHIQFPPDKKHLVKVFNTPAANAQSVAEYTICCALMCAKRIAEGERLYRKGKVNKYLSKKPEDLLGKILGVFGAGNVSARIIKYAEFFGMSIICHTKHPENHRALAEKGVKFVSADELAVTADIISVNLPLNEDTKNFICAELIRDMKNDAIFISVSRLDVVCFEALFEKASQNQNFYVCLDIDVDDDIRDYLSKSAQKNNIIITPHIAGGTVEARRRMFKEVALQISDFIKQKTV